MNQLAELRTGMRTELLPIIEAIRQTKGKAHVPLLPVPFLKNDKHLNEVVDQLLKLTRYLGSPTHSATSLIQLNGTLPKIARPAGVKVRPLGDI